MKQPNHHEIDNVDEAATKVGIGTLFTSLRMQGKDIVFTWRISLILRVNLVPMYSTAITWKEHTEKGRRTGDYTKVQV